MHQPLFINGRFLTQGITGIQRFSYELCRALIEKCVEIILLAPGKIRKEYKLNCRIIRFGIFQDILWEQLDLPVFLFKHNNPLLLNFGSPGPLFYKNRIVTVHDLSFYINPSWFSKSYSVYYRLITPVYTRLSKKVITVSEFSKNELKKLAGIPDDKISVIHNAVSATMKKEKPAIPGKKERYILSVASMDPRKNLDRLVNAYKQSGIEKDIKLVLAGKTDTVFAMEPSEEIRSNAIGYVPDEELAALYANADLFIYPSLYEGFGIPPLEAMSLGCPVVLSDIPVFREIFGDAACYIDPLDTGSIRDGILRVLNDEPYRNELIRRGRERNLLYSWEGSAEKLTAIINSLA